MHKKTEIKYLIPTIIFTVGLVVSTIAGIRYFLTPEKTTYEYIESEAISTAVKENTIGTKYVLDESGDEVTAEEESENLGTGSNAGELEELVDEIDKRASEEQIINP